MYLMSLSQPMVCSFCGVGVATDAQGMAYPGDVPVHTVCNKDECCKAHLAAAMQSLAMRPLKDMHGDPSAPVAPEKSPVPLRPRQCHAAVVPLWRAPKLWLLPSCCAQAH